MAHWVRFEARLLALGRYFWKVDFCTQLESIQVYMYRIGKHKLVC